MMDPSELDDDQLSHLVYLRWRGPMLCSTVDSLHHTWDDLIREGLVCISDAATGPFPLIGRITDSGQEVLRATDLTRLVRICLVERAFHAVESLIKQLSAEELPAFLAFPDRPHHSMYARLFACERLRELTEEMEERT